MERDEFGLPVRRSFSNTAAGKVASSRTLYEEKRRPSPLIEDKPHAKFTTKERGNNTEKDYSSSQKSDAPRVLLKVVAEGVTDALKRGVGDSEGEKSATAITDRDATYQKDGIQTRDSSKMLHTTVDKIVKENCTDPPLSTVASMIKMEVDTVWEMGSGVGQRQNNVTGNEIQDSTVRQKVNLQRKDENELRKRKMAQDIYLKREPEKLETQERQDLPNSQQREQPGQQKGQQDYPIHSKVEVVWPLTGNGTYKDRWVETKFTNDAMYKPLSIDEKSVGVPCNPRVEKSDEECQMPQSSGARTSPTNVNNSPVSDVSIIDVNDENVEGSIVCLSDNEEDRVIRFLYKQKVYGFPSSDGSMLSNFWHYFKNGHPLFSICLCHRLNPYSKRSRAIVYFCMTSMAYCLTVGLMETDYFMDNNICKAGCDVTTDSSGECACSGGMNDGRSCSSFNYLCEYVSPITIGALCGAIVAIYGAVLRAFATLGCCQGMRLLQTRCVLFINFVNNFGGHVLTFFLGFSVCLFVVVLLVADVDAHQHVRIVRTFGTSKLFSLVYW